MGTLKKTGEWVYLIRPIPVEPPVEKLSIYFAKPKYLTFEDARLSGNYEEYLMRAKNFAAQRRIPWSEFSLEKYTQLIYDYLNGDKPDDQGLCDDLEIEISLQWYTLEDMGHGVEIITPFGPVTVHPEEYNIVDLDWALRTVEEGSHIIRYLDNQGSIRPSMKNITVNDKIFYLRSRGIGFTSAMRMVSGEIKTQHLMYFDPLPQYVEIFQRNYLEYLYKKLQYCQKNNHKELLYYSPKDDDDFHLSEYITHLTKQYNHA